MCWFFGQEVLIVAICTELIFLNSSKFDTTEPTPCRTVPHGDIGILFLLRWKWLLRASKDLSVTEGFTSSRKYRFWARWDYIWRKLSTVWFEVHVTIGRHRKYQSKDSVRIIYIPTDWSTWKLSERQAHGATSYGIQPFALKFCFGNHFEESVWACILFSRHVNIWRTIIFIKFNINR